MPDYGVTDKGFVLKRLDVILEEIHTDLTEGFGFDTQLENPSFLGVLVTTFAGQVADLWETAQDSYYAKYPATATGLNLDNAVQYGGIRRAASRRTAYLLHCTGQDGTYIRDDAAVATDTSPEIRLYAANESRITRESFNSVDIIVAAAQEGVYTVSINGKQYSYTSADGEESGIIAGLHATVSGGEYEASVVSGNTLRIADTDKGRSNALILSENLTTSSVTTIIPFVTEDYGRITLPSGVVTKMVENVTGFESVINMLEPVYGRKEESDIELRQSYIANSALRSNTMIDSIVAELLNNVENVESASGYENDSDHTNERGLPPHSIEIVVEGGDKNEIAQAILRKKAGGIQTFGKVAVDVLGNYGDTIPVHFNRPEYLYAWLKLVLHGDPGRLPVNYVQLTTASLLECGVRMVAGTNLLTQLLTDGIYSTVAGLTYIDIYTAYGMERTYVPEEGDYRQKNIIATSRQKVLLDETRIGVVFCADT